MLRFLVEWPSSHDRSRVNSHEKRHHARPGKTGNQCRSQECDAFTFTLFVALFAPLLTLQILDTFQKCVFTTLSSNTSQTTKVVKGRLRIYAYFPTLLCIVCTLYVGEKILPAKKKKKILPDFSGDIALTKNVTFFHL